MRVALVHPRLDARGGAENVVLWMARGLQKRGHDVVVAARKLPSDRWNQGDWEGIPLVRLEEGRLDRLRSRRGRKRVLGKRLASALGSCDVIVAHNEPAPLWATVAAERMPRTRVVWFCEEPRAQFHWRTSMPHFAAAIDDLAKHPWLEEVASAWYADRKRDDKGPRKTVDRELDLAAARRADCVLGNSAFTAKNAEKVYDVRAEPCLLGMHEPDPIEVVSDAPYVAWVGSMVAHKNAYGFLQAIHIAVNELGARDLRLRSVGVTGDEVVRRIEELGIAGVVQPAGWIDDAELNALVAGCRLLAYPTIDEPFGLVPLHAMAHGRPVLASSLGGPAETVVDGVTGLHANPLDPRDMAERLCELWNDPQRCDALGAAGREHFGARLTFEHFLDRFEAAAFGGDATA